MSDIALHLRGRPRGLGVVLTVPLVVAVSSLVIVGVMIGDDVFAVFGELVAAALLSMLVFIAVDNWFGWLSVRRDNSEWVITRGSPVRRHVQRIPIERIVFVETRFEPRAPIYDIVLGSQWDSDSEPSPPARFTGLWFVGRRIGRRSWGPLVRVHFALPPIGGKFVTPFVDLGKGLDRLDDLERLRDLLARKP